MIRSTAVLRAVLSIGGASGAYAQETSPGPGIVEVTVIPGGATFFTSGDRGPEFSNYNLGGALTYNINRIVGVEGEVVAEASLQFCAAREDVVPLASVAVGSMDALFGDDGPSRLAPADGTGTFRLWSIANCMRCACGSDRSHDPFFG